MRDRQPLVVYWSPGQFILDTTSYNLLYQEPESVADKFYGQMFKGAASLKCPAARFFFHNTFSLNSTIDNEFYFPQGLLEDIYFDEGMHYDLPVESSVRVAKSRENQMEGYVNIEYHHSWFFFCEEDLEMSFTAPYFPAKSPIEDALLASGSFNIGSWLRPLNLEYYVPLGARKFSIQQDEPLAFVKFDTDRPIVFKRFVLTKKLANIVTEIVESDRYRFLNNLLKRYNLFKKSRMKELILSEIRQNLV